MDLARRPALGGAPACITNTKHVLKSTKNTSRASATSVVSVTVARTVRPEPASSLAIVSRMLSHAVRAKARAAS